MAANITNNIGSWNVTAASNQPDAADTADLQSDLQAIQSAVKKIRAISADIASGATVDLSTATGDFVTVTGTTGITAFGTVAAGLRYIVRFSGSLNITHDGTSLILPGGTNITTQANDILWMESLGSGNWRCLAYMPVHVTRTWQVVSASRALATEYTNTTSYDIEVFISLTPSSAPHGAYLYVNNTVSADWCYLLDATRAQLRATIPPGAIYEVISTTSNHTIQLWNELR